MALPYSIKVSRDLSLPDYINENAQVIISKLYHDELRLTWSIFLVGCILFITNLDFTSTGDAIYYANIIDTLRFDQLTVHQGYYLIGYLFAQLFTSIGGLPTDQALALMNALFGAGALCIGYLLLKHYLESTRDALLGTIILLLCHRFFVNSTSAEVYIVQTFFIWSSYLLFERRSFYSAGIAIGIAMWVSPLTVAFGLVFPVVAWLRGYGIRALIKLSIPALLIYLPFLFLFYEELFWGVRGLIEQDEQRDIDLALTAQDVFRYQIKHYSFLNLLFLPALMELKREKQLLYISIAATIPNIYVISQLPGEDNVFILTLDIFIVCWYMIGWRYLRERSLAPLAIVILLAHVFVFLFSERPFIDDTHKNYADEMVAIGHIVQDSEESIIFMDWARRMAFVYYNRDEASYPIEQGHWYDISGDIADIIKYKKFGTDDFAGYETFYVLESYSASPRASLFLSEQSLRERYETMSEKRRIERFLNVKCRLIRPGLHKLYKCDS